jgi:hypothetical protein
MPDQGADRFIDYVAAFNSRVRDGRFGDTEDSDDVCSVSPREMAFTEVFLETLEDIGQLPGLDTVYFEKKLGRANGKVNAYGVSEVDARVDLVVTVNGIEENGGPKAVARKEIETAVKNALHTFGSAKSPVHKSMEPSSASYDMMEHLNRVHADTNDVRVIVLINGIAKKIPKFKSSGDVPRTQVDVWDLERLCRADSSALGYESFTINFEDYIGRPLPCISAEADSEDHSCYLAVIPGDMLHDLYDKYGPRLLELNVRSFLQARGKVNRGIQDTLRNDPEHFLAYNNGISVTVEGLDLVKSPEGSLAIRSVHGMQIVNGGQTAASIHRAKNRFGADLSAVAVQAKITKVDPAHLETLVPNISRYSNTQNKVNETDFSANHPFHVRIQQLSEEAWVPGETSRWFYERARGQWEVARVREATTPAKKKGFDQKTPRNQKVDKTLLAKAVNAWSEFPHIVSLGGQKNFVQFMLELKSRGDSWEPDEAYYKDVIAKVLILRCCESLARKIGFSAYRANAVCYTVSLLAYRTAGRVNLEDIWNNQGVSDSMEETLRCWMSRVHEEIVESAGGRNVTEWCKKKECWTHIQSLNIEFAPGFETELAEGLPLPNVGRFREKKGATPRPLTEEERERQAVTMKYGTNEWIEILKWGRESGVLTDFELKISASILGYAAGGWRQVPSPKQTRWTIEIIQSWEATGRVREE